MKEILSVQDYEKIEENMAGINGNMVEFRDSLINTIAMFDTNQIVQEFYNSGKYGKGIQERLKQIRQLTDQYINYITTGEDSLYHQTKKYTSEQIDLLLSDANGYTRTDSIRARREFNQS